MSDQRITTPCPLCGNRTLFVGSGGHLTCSLIGCKQPVVRDRIAELEGERVAWAVQRLTAQLPDLEAELMRLCSAICEESRILGKMSVTPTEMADAIRPLLHRAAGVRADADYRDCLELAAAIAKSVECYDSDDLLEVIVPHLQPVIGRLEQLERDAAGVRADDGEPLTEAVNG